MSRISRARRAELQRRAQEIRRAGQRSGWSVRRIAAAIQAELPQLLPLEAWRLSYGWTRPQTVEAVAKLFTAEGLAAPALNTSMLCRYEHGESRPGEDYARALCRLYRVDSHQLGLGTDLVLSPERSRAGGYGRKEGVFAGPLTNRHLMAENQAAALAAVRESIQLALEVEGPAGGLLAREQLQAAVDYYNLRFSSFAPAVLALEVHRTRALVGRMLQLPQDDSARADLRCLAGWLSALTGNLAYFLGDHTAAQIHFATAARLGTAIGHHHLTCWSLGAQSMTATAQGRHPEALDLARQALDYADTPLRRAQILAWAELKALTAMNDPDATRVMGAAQDQMAADPDGDVPGRFGFDHPELRLHLAEAALQSGEHAQARRHAGASRDELPAGRPGWAAASLVLARAEAARGHRSDATALAAEVLDTIPAPALRETSRARLHDLDTDLFTAGTPGPDAHALRDRLRILPSLTPVGRLSAEPNGL